MMGFDEQAERAAVLLPRVGQGVAIKPGVTRAQAERYFKRWNAWQQARLFRYRNGPTAAQLVEDYLGRGAALVFRGARYYLALGGEEVRLDSACAYEYAKVLTEWGGYERTY